MVKVFITTIQVKYMKVSLRMKSLMAKVIS